MNKRKLYLPRGLDIPARLRPIVSETVATSAIHSGMGPAPPNSGIDQEWLAFGDLRSGPLWQRRTRR